MKSVDQALDPRANGFNWLRLTFALSVIVYHSFAVGGFEQPAWAWFLSELGVDCFFIISGYLIARSWTRRRSAGRFMWHRVLRIFPGFYVCLFVTAVVAGVISLNQGSSLGDFLKAPEGPLSYLTSNWHLVIYQPQIAGTPGDVPDPRYWNLPLWTLGWEFQCYLGILALGVVGLINRSRRWAILAAFLGCYGLLIVLQVAPGVEASLPGRLAGEFSRFTTCFLVGSTLFLFADRIRSDGRLALVAAAVVLCTLAFVDDYRAIAIVPIAYLLVWVASNSTGPSLIRKHDISYGVYIYGYVVQQSLAVVGAQGLGYVFFTLLSVAAVVPIATASWFLIEKPMLRLKDWAPRRDSERQVDVAVATGGE